MKYFFSLLISLLSLLPLSAKTGILYMKSPAGYQVLSISPSGEWACGVYYDENSDTNYGFRWNLLTDNLQLIGGACQAMSISNTGVIAGSYYPKIDGKTIEVPATWDGTSWTILERPNDYGAWAYAISPDGQYVTGTDNKYKSYIWKNGKLDTRITIVPSAVEADGTFITYAISPDGTKAGGWAYFSDDNRNPGYYDKADGKFHCLEPLQPGSPWQAVKKFSADSKKALFWGGYHVDPKAPGKGYGIHAIYNTETQDTTYIYPTLDDPFNFDLFDMNADASVVVGYQQDDEGTELGIIWADSTTRFVEDYLKDLGCSFSDDEMYSIGEYHYICRAVALSGDAKTIAILYYDNEFNYHTMIVALDRDLSLTPPVNLTATKMTGIPTVQITWQEPLGDKSTLQSYLIYRNGDLIATIPAQEGALSYYDTNLPYGTHTYTIAAVYSEGTSPLSSPVSVEVAELLPQPPTSLLARQKGYISAYAIWQEPASNLPDINYYSKADGPIQGFGGGSVSFESATLYPSGQMSLYEGYRVSSVSFYPKSAQGSWLVNLYTHNADGTLKTLASQKVTQELEYGVKNTVKLNRTVTLQSGNDLLVGIQTNVTEASYDVQGIFENCLSVGYTDLIRQVGEKNFYSINEMSNGASYDMAWGTSIILSQPDASAAIDSVAGYNIYLDDALLTTTAETSFLSSDIATGSHTLGVQTVYADSRTSEVVSASLYISPKKAHLKSLTPELDILGTTVTASWTAPTDVDATTVCYCGSKPATRSPKATDDVSEIYARIDFTPTELAAYPGYQINSLEFYPLSNASFVLALYDEEEMVAQQLVDEFAIDEWKTVELDKPVTIRPNHIYHYVIDAYDCPSGESPLAIDSNGETNSYSSYLQAAGEEGWYTVYEETGLSGNWLMRMNMSDPNGPALPLDNCDIYIDSEKVATAVTTASYTHTFPEITDETHSLRVDANYTQATATTKGTPATFNLFTTGIEELPQSGITTVASPAFTLSGTPAPKGHKGFVITTNKKLFVK